MVLCMLSVFDVLLPWLLRYGEGRGKAEVQKEGREGLEAARAVRVNQALRRVLYEYECWC